MLGSPVNSSRPSSCSRERRDRVGAREAERAGRGQQVVVGRRVADVLAAPLVAAAAHHDRGRDALEPARDRLRLPLVGDVVDQHGQRRDAVIGSHGTSCYAAMTRPAAQRRPACGSPPEAPAPLAEAVRARRRRGRRRRRGERPPLVRLRRVSARSRSAVHALAAARLGGVGAARAPPASRSGSSTALVDDRARLDVGGRRLRRGRRRARRRAAARLGQAPGRVRARRHVAAGRSSRACRSPAARSASWARAASAARRSGGWSRSTCA